MPSIFFYRKDSKVAQRTPAMQEEDNRLVDYPLRASFALQIAFAKGGGHNFARRLCELCDTFASSAAAETLR